MQTQFQGTAENTIIVFQPYTVNRQAVQMAFIGFVDGCSWLQDGGSNKPVGMRKLTDGMKIRNQSKLLLI